MAGERYAPLAREEASGLLGGLAAEEDWRLCLPYVPDDRRGGALVLYALAKELADAPARVSEAPLGLVRFQWWREAVAEAFGDGPVRQHPLAQAIGHALGAAPAMRTPLDALVDGAEEALSIERPPSIVGEAVELALPLYGRLGTALTVWLTGTQVRAEPVAQALALWAAVSSAGGEARAGRGLARVADGLARGPTPDAYAGGIAAHLRTLRRLPAVLTPAALPFALAPAYAAGRAPGPLAKRTRLFRTALTGRF